MEAQILANNQTEGNGTVGVYWFGLMTQYIDKNGAQPQIGRGAGRKFGLPCSGRGGVCLERAHREPGHDTGRAELSVPALHHCGHHCGHRRPANHAMVSHVSQLCTTFDTPPGTLQVLHGHAGHDDEDQKVHGAAAGANAAPQLGAAEDRAPAQPGHHSPRRERGRARQGVGCRCCQSRWQSR